MPLFNYDMLNALFYHLDRRAYQARVSRRIIVGTVLNLSTAHCFFSEVEHLGGLWLAIMLRNYSDFISGRESGDDLSSAAVSRSV
jgi:hypothetical protein